MPISVRELLSILTFTIERGHLNLDGRPTGKKSLDHVKACVVAKARTIRPANIILYFYHCVGELVKYLTFELN